MTIFLCLGSGQARHPDDPVKPTPVVVSHGHIAGILIIQSGKCLKTGGVYESYLMLGINQPAPQSSPFQAK